MPTPSFPQDVLDDLFPPERADAFFEALYGGAEEGAYDIRLVCRQEEEKQLSFDFELHQRPGKCLVCSLTYGLPQVFSRHPIINASALARTLAARAGWDPDAISWKFGNTQEHSRELHCVPLIITRA